MVNVTSPGAGSLARSVKRNDRASRRRIRCRVETAILIVGRGLAGSAATVKMPGAALTTGVEIPPIVSTIHNDAHMVVDEPGGKSPARER